MKVRNGTISVIMITLTDSYHFFGKTLLRVRPRVIPDYIYPELADFLPASTEDQSRTASDQENTNCAEQQIAHTAGLRKDETFLVDNGAGAGWVTYPTIVTSTYVFLYNSFCGGVFGV